MNINLDVLNNFVVVAQAGNLLAASKMIGTTQPNLGRQMTALEKEVSLALFARHSRGLALTEGGQKFLILCQNTLGQLKHETNLIREQAQGLNGSLRIMKAPGTTKLVLGALSLFRRKHPKVQCSVISASDISKLYVADIDVGVLPALPHDPNRKQRYVCDLGVRLYASSNYFKGREVPKTLDDLKYHMVIFCDSSPGSAGSPLNFHASVDNFASGIKLSEEMLEDALIGGLGIAPFPSSNKLKGKSIIDVFPDMPDYKAPLYFTHHQRLKGAPNVETFYECLKQVVASSECPDKQATTY